MSDRCSQLLPSGYVCFPLHSFSKEKIPVQQGSPCPHFSWGLHDLNDEGLVITLGLDNTWTKAYLSCLWQAGKERKYHTWASLTKGVCHPVNFSQSMVLQVWHNSGAVLLPSRPWCLRYLQHPYLGCETGLLVFFKTMSVPATGSG